MEKVAKIIRSLATLSIAALLAALTMSILRLIEVVGEQRSIVEATISVAEQRCKLDERLDTIETRLDEFGQKTIILKLTPKVK